MLGFHCEQRVHAVTRSAPHRDKTYKETARHEPHDRDKKFIDIKSARARGVDSLRIIRMALAQTLHSVEDSVERYAATEDLSVQAECVNIAILRICNDLLPKLRIDTAADAQAALMVAAARRVTA